MGLKEIREREEARQENSSRRYAYTDNRFVMYSISMALYLKYIVFTCINIIDYIYQ